MFSKKTLVLCTALGVLAIFSVPLIPLLIVSEYGSNKVLLVLSAEPFEIAYTHSVNKSRVYDCYEPSNGNIVLVKTKFTAYGAGITEPEPGQHFAVSEEFFEIQNINRKMDKLLLATGTIANHELISNSGSIFFNSIVQPQTKLMFKIEKKSLFFYSTIAMHSLFN